MSMQKTNPLNAVRTSPFTGMGCVRSTMLAVMAGLTLALPAVAQSDKPEDKPADKAGAPSDAKVNKLDLPYDNMGTNKDDPNAAVVYVIPVRGEVGMDFTATPLRKALADAKRVKADIVVLDIDSQFRTREDGEMPEEFQSFSAVDSISLIARELIDNLRDDPTWEKKPRVVSWVRRAMGPAAFLPLITKDIYFTPTGRMGGCGYLDFKYLDGSPDQVVREKWRDNDLKSVEGLAIKGQHDFRIVRAMCRMDYVLSYTMVGGKPEFHEDMSGDTILTDDGNPDAGRSDTAEERIRGDGNDHLNLNAVIGKRIGFIAGEAATMDDLAFELGVQRAYKVYGRRAERVLKEWSSQVDRLLPTYRALQREEREWRLTGDTSAERNQSRSKLKRIIQKQIDLLMQNPEMTLVRGFGGPDAATVRMRQRLAVIDRDIRLDRDR